MTRFVLLCALATSIASHAAPWGRLFTDAAQRQQPRVSAASATSFRLSACAWMERRKRCWVDGQAAASAPAQVRVGERWRVQP